MENRLPLSDSELQELEDIFGCDDNQDMCMNVTVEDSDHPAYAEHVSALLIGW